jgi:uncharacterized protein YbcI
MNALNDSIPSVSEQIAQAAAEFQRERTGHAPDSVNVVISGDTLVVTLQGVLSPGEQLMSQQPEGAAKVAEFHRELFRTSSQSLRAQIKRITKMDLREAQVDVEPTAASIVQVFPTGTMVQVFLLTHPLASETWSGNGDAVRSAVPSSL